jgi:ABC-2 type transport system permease protein
MTWLATLRTSCRGEVRFLLQDRSVLLLLLALPLLYPAVITFLYRQQQAVERPAAVVDLDNSALSRRLLVSLEATQELRFVARPASVEAGQRLLARREVELVVYVPEELSRDVKRGRMSEVRVFASSANLYTWGQAFPAVYEVVGALNAQLGAATLVRRGLSPRAALLRAGPVRRVEHLLFHPTGGYARFLAVGVLLIVVQQLVVVSLCFSLGLRRERGLWDDGAARPWSRILGAALAHLPFWLAAAALIVFGVLPAAGWSGPSRWSSAVLFAAFVAAMAPVAVLSASVMRTRVAALQLPMFFSVPLFMISGFTWPADQMPWAVRAVAALFPSTPALQALRVLSMKSGALSAVAPQLLWLLALALLWTAVGAWVAHCPLLRLHLAARRTAPTPLPEHWP